jgi:gliding motility-associated-like protein
MHEHPTKMMLSKKRYLNNMSFIKEDLPIKSNDGLLQISASNWLKKLIILVPLLWTLDSMCQTGPAGVGANDGSSALQLWLDASQGVFVDTSQTKAAGAGDRIKLWKDLSGSHNHAFAQTDTARPKLDISSPLLNNQRAIRFSQNQDTLNRRNYLATKSFSKTNDITIYCVFHPLSKASGNDITPFQSNKFNSNMWYDGAGLVDAGASGFVNDISLAFCDTSIAAGGGDSTTATDYCVKTPVSLHKTYFATLQKEAWTGHLSISKNASIPVVFQAGPQPINNPLLYYIGSNANTTSPPSSPYYTSPFFDGYIANVLVYNRLLTAIEKTILENYLAAKYGIALQNNDIYTFDDSTAGNYDFEVVGIGMAGDGSSQTSAKGDGLLELTNPIELDKGNYLFVGNDGKSSNPLSEDSPEGIQARIERKWACTKIGTLQKIDVIVDPIVFPSATKDDFVLLIDTDNNGSFSDEIVGKGIIPNSEVTSHGRFAFRGVSLAHGNKFTFAKMKPACQTNCEAYFTPNGDGVSDLYYLDHSGKTSIFDRSGKLIKAMSTPAYWDGTNETGEVSAAGIYFLVSNEDVQKTVTLIR